MASRRLRASIERSNKFGVQKRVAEPIQEAQQVLQVPFAW